jgi:quercetin dioxygenase-like cupin family protein
MTRSKLLVLATFAILTVAGVTSAAWGQTHVMEPLKSAKWGPAPPFIPKGAQMEVLNGDPTGDALYTLRLKFPANYKIAAHSHPKDEHVTVLSGDLFMGMGDKLDMKAGKGLGLGGFALMPAGQNHFAFTKTPTVVLLHGIGPVEFKYVNPADDPRNAKK